MGNAPIPKNPSEPRRARLTQITWETPSGWQVSEDCDQEVTITTMQPVLDARALHEERPVRFGWEPAAYLELRRRSALAGEELPSAVIDGFNRLRESRKIQVFAERQGDGRVRISLCTRPEDNVPLEIVEDLARLMELLSHLQRNAIYSKDTLRRILRERFPTLPRIAEYRLLEAAFTVLREPRVWRENMTPTERGKYLATSAYNAINKQPVHEDEDPDFQIEPPPTDKPDAVADPESLLIERDYAEKFVARALALPNLRAGERKILELVITGKSWTEARDMVDLPDSYRVGLLKKVKKLTG